MNGSFNTNNLKKYASYNLDPTPKASGSISLQCSNKWAVVSSETQQKAHRFSSSSMDNTRLIIMNL